MIYDHVDVILYNHTIRLYVSKYENFVMWQAPTKLSYKIFVTAYLNAIIALNFRTFYTIIFF